MIKLLDKYDGLDLRDSHYSRVIRAHLDAYGTGYDFCRFYEIVGKHRVGVIAIFNSAVAVDFVRGAKVTNGAKRELSEFIEFQSPISVELPNEFLPRSGFSGYVSFERIFFAVPPSESAVGITEPDPEAVFNTVFGEAGDYGLWLTDTMRRINGGRSRLLSYESAVLTVRFAVDKRAYITDVATPPDDRGKGYARTLLGGAAKLLKGEGLSAYLAAFPETAGYYRSLGYQEIDRDTVFNLREVPR